MGIMVKEELCEKVLEVRRVSDRMMTVVVVFEDDVLRLLCVYAPQSIRLEEKQSFYDELEGEFNVHSVGDVVTSLGDFN